jgi:AI-2E family transporter
VLVALVTVGPVKALIILGVVIAVQQLEGHVLQPLIMGRAVALHPLTPVPPPAETSVDPVDEEQAVVAETSKRR